MCLKSGSTKIHDYYVKLEKILFEVMYEESQDIRNQFQAMKDSIEAKNLEQSSKDEAKEMEIRLKNEEKEMELRLKDIEKRVEISNALVNSFRKKHVVYIGYIGIINGRHCYKFGYTDNIKRRVSRHKSEYGSFDLVQNFKV